MDEHPQTVPPPQYPDGSRVLFADGQTLGEVVTTYREYLIVERGYFFPTNFYVPYAAIAEAGGGDIVLSLTGKDALAQGWHTPPLDPVVPEAQEPASPLSEPVPAAQGKAAASKRKATTTPPPADPVATTAAPVVAKAAAVADEVSAEEFVAAAPEPNVAVTTTASPTVAVAAEPEMPSAETAAPSLQEKARTQPADSHVAPQRVAPASATSTTPAPAAPPAEMAAVKEAVEVQSFQPDASVPPPGEPEEAGTVSIAPSFVGIPGRRLTDAELWSLLEPKIEPSESDDPDKPDDPAKNTDASEKPGS